MKVPYKDFGRARRQSVRREFHHPGILVAADCKRWATTIIDISETGAQLQLGNNANVPGELVLLIGGKNAIQRQCQIVWRSTDRLGVKFIGRQAKSTSNVP
ncbi:MAG: PilZ domain-containing protein [Xanthobacteraceae bacterium]|nr:PilZ domain-containing protein [Xanthobacteraceae bacterium]